MKYYTGIGDNGDTLLPNNIKISKDSEITNIIGDIDELNSLFGLIINYIDDEYINNIIKSIQDRLFNIGAEIIIVNSNTNKKDNIKFNFSEKNIKDLEEVIDEISIKLSDLNKFILPGGSESASWLHYARAIVRKVERNFVGFSKTNKLNPNILKYINRLSSFFFVAARYMNKKEGIKEINPTYTP
ncbi:MAG: cob(I)yrinic acid a,c-diamide adenosyltransferase [Candidatus Micrarchaeia archaeon]